MAENMAVLTQEMESTDITYSIVVFNPIFGEMFFRQKVEDG